MVRILQLILASFLISIPALSQNPTVVLRGKTFKLSWWDEFSGPAVDSTRWDFRRDSKNLSTQLARNNFQENGILRQFLRKETSGGKSYTAGGLISEDTLHYGYYEAKIKTPPKKGWHSGFWLMKQDGTGGTGVAKASLEIDILENESENINSFTCLHRKYNPVTNFGTKTFNTSALSSGFIKVGCLYEQDSIIYYYDGKQVDKRYVGNLTTGKMNIWLTSIGYTSPINDAVLPSTFEVDYIRFYELNPPLKAPVTLNPVADSYVQNNGAESSNFGNSTTLLCQNSSSGTKAEAIFRFDLSSFKYYIGSAKLRVYARNQTNNTNPVRIRATGLANTSVWNESVVNWNNKPSESGSWNDEKTITGTTGQYYEWDVTSYIQAQKEGSLRNSVGIKLSQLPGYDDIVEMISKEGGSNPPVLVIKPLETVPVIMTHPKDTVWMKDSVLNMSVAVNSVKPAFYQWKKNGVTIAGATSPTLSFPVLQLADSGYYSVRVSYGIGFDTVESRPGKVTVKTSNLKPTANFIAPLAGSDYAMSQVIALSGNGTDPETGALKSPDIRWSYRYYRNGTLVNAQFIGAGFNVNFTIPVTAETGTNSFYRILMVARDPQGARDSVWRDIYPRVKNVTVQTNPAGYQITVYGVTQNSPFNINAIEGSPLPLGVIDPQGAYVFQSWSQGGAQSQNYIVPASGATPTANLVNGNITIRNTIADAYVLGNSSTNFGTQTMIGSKLNAATNQIRESYLRFDLTNLPGSLLNARLRLYGGLSDNNNPSLKVDVRQVNTTGVWEETTINWSNKPATISTILASTECFGTTKVYYEWDLTSFLQSQLSQGKSSVNLHLSSPDETASRIDFNSKEAGIFLPELRFALTDGPPVVTQQPVSITVCEGLNTSFSSSASAMPAATVQWQVSTNSGGVWSPISGANLPGFSITTALSDNGKWYRAAWTNGYGTVYSNAAVLTIRQKPAASIQASGPVSFCEGGSVTLSALPVYAPPSGPVTIIADRTSPTDVISMLPAAGSTTPNGEEVYRAIDNSTSTKYLNLLAYSGGNGNSGVEIALNFGATIITGISITSANDAPDRDPKTYTISGSNDGINWSAISSGSVPAFTARFQKQTITFSNSKAFSKYRVVVPTIASTGSASMQFSELELLETSLSVPDYTYSWNTGATNSSIISNTNGSVSVTVTDSYGCSAVATQNITVHPNPQIFNVSGGGSYCSNSSSGVSVQLSGSETGVDYRFEYTNGDSVDHVTGTGFPLISDSIPGTGSVIVKAKNSTTGCLSNMNGSASVLVAPNQLWFEDYDGDGFGNPAVSRDTCFQPVGFVNVAGDCFDTVSTVACYCKPLDMNCSATHFESLQIHNLTFTGNCDNNSGYAFYPAINNQTTVMQRGLEYPFSIQTSDGQSGTGIWCDFNNDFDFDDANEFLYGSLSTGTNFSGNIAIPANTATGERRLRIRTVRGSTLTSGDACTYFAAGGETKDFTISINQPTIVINSPLEDICAGTNITVSFVTTGTFLAGNYFQVQLSNSTGVFGAGTSALGNGNSSPITCHVNIGSVPGIYRIRVVSATPAPAVFGTNSAYFNIKPKPATPTSNAVNRCGPGTVTLTASGCSSIEWYDASTKGNQIGSGFSYTTPVITSSKNYYAACIDENGCQSLRKLTSAVVVSPPTISGFSPLVGQVGYTTITITGTSFNQVDSVVFGGNAKAQILSSTTTSITVKTPINAVNGQIRVYTPCGVVNSASSFTAVIPTISAPVFSQSAGTYSSGITTTLSCATVGADIYYTLNGVTPDPNSAVTKLYAGEQIQVGVNLTIKAIGYRKGWISSPVSVASYLITSPTIVATPTISPASGAYTGGQVLTLTCSTPQSTIWYTTNGQIPSIGKSSTFRYLGPVTLTAPSVTIRAIAVRDGWSQSAVAVSYVTISGATTLSACTFSPAPGTYGSAQTVVISNQDPLAQIFYTTDGTDPYMYLPLAKPYAGPVSIPASRTLKAQAYRPGFGDSPRTIGNYTISAGRQSLDVSENTENPAPNNYSVLPNPFGNRFSLVRNMVSGNKVTIRIFDGSGRIVLEEKPEDNWARKDLDSGLWPAGLYILRITDKNGEQHYMRMVKE